MNNNKLILGFLLILKNKLKKKKKWKEIEKKMK